MCFALYTKEKKKNHVPLRLNIIFFFVFFLFLVLILRLIFVQIVYGANYKREIERIEDVTINHPVPRGKIFDRTGKIIVDNIPENAIIFTNSGKTNLELLEMAQNLSDLIDKETEKVNERDKKDYWIQIHKEKAESKISQIEREALKEKYIDKEFDQQIYKLTLDRITEEDLKELTNKDLEIISIYSELASSSSSIPHIVKNHYVSNKEIAVVSEHLQSFPGIDTTTDWERYYAFHQTLKSVLGSVTSADEGIPSEQLDYYLAKDYSRNDRVGRSYIELEYENVLQGQKAKIKNITDSQGNIIDSKVVTQGRRGKDLILSIDMELQLEVEKIIEEELMYAKKFPGTRLLDRAYVVLMDPKSGEVLSMAGKKIVTDSKTNRVIMEDDALGNITTSYNVGSVVKGATILTGFREGAIVPGQQFDDQAIKIKGTPRKASWSYLGVLDDVEALKFSSNVYMFRTAIKLGHGKYQYNKPLLLDTNAFRVLRDSFAQYGLGVRTGIDLPNEQTGYKGASTLPGLMLDFVIGQYDTYTTMQLAQYVSTIANGGYRMEPHIVREIREPEMKNEELGPIISEISPKVLNKVDVEDAWIKRVQIGFRKVMQEKGGTAYRIFANKTYDPAGKTGTAEAFYDGPKRNNFDALPEVMNLSLIGYAPSKNPEIAMAVMVPWAYQGDKDHGANKKIGERVLDAYFLLKKKRQNQYQIDSGTKQKVENYTEVQKEISKQREVN